MLPLIRPQNRFNPPALTSRHARRATLTKSETPISALALLRGALLVFLLLITPAAAQAAEPRFVLSLDGLWEAAEGDMDQPPQQFTHSVPVPGLMDMAKPAFAGVGTTNSTQLRQAFWLRKTFRLEQPLPAIAQLKIHKASYGTRVFLNGQCLGEHLPSFTPGYFDAHAALRGNGATNELVIRIGAFRTALPSHIPNGWDFEKTKYIAGVYDTVELILSGTPHIVRVQTAPQIDSRTVHIQGLLTNNGSPIATRAHLKIREVKSGAAVAQRALPISIESGATCDVDTQIAIPNCRLWSPEDPFLYELEISTGNDTVRTRFGMRSFRFDPTSGRALLNGKPYFLRGSNVTLYRFFEDAERGDKPWRQEWVRRLHRAFKSMHWNSLRYCIGFPPELWYRIADEEGMLIQDEYPLWHLSGDRFKETWPAQLTRHQLALEYTEWMQERWNHPCVVVWDAQNETVTAETGAAIQKVRHLDLSDRPWDNGWAAPENQGDCFESHPYMASNAKFRLADMARLNPVPRGNAVPNSRTNAIIINEYGWLWLNRDGTPTTLTRNVYKNLLGDNATPSQRRQLYSRYLAAKTEFWRAHRACAGVLHFCGLGYSRPDGQTSDHFADVESLAFEPEFELRVRDAFAPVGLMLDFWAEEMAPGEVTVPVVAINDLYETWSGNIHIQLHQDQKLIHTQQSPCAIEPLGQTNLRFTLTIPDKPGNYELIAMLRKGEQNPIRSRRAFTVPAPK